ncbi:MAG: hypothetical protein HQM10_07570 [Candidatus Riflebacteria bacterium]|nr:hypothetical protein [Candidatus Riflebacteria bacterium]
MAEQGRQIAFRSKQTEVARQIVEGALEEAYSWFNRETADPKSAASQWLISRKTDLLSIPLKVSADEAKNMVRANVSPELTAFARLVEYRTNDVSGAPYSSSDGKDCIGTVEFGVKLILNLSNSPSGKAVMSFKGVRHNEYQLASIVSPRDNSTQRSSYSQCFLLDYVLFVRNGLDEFRKYNSFSLNNEKKRIIIEQKSLPADKRGKIYIGETDPQKSATGQLTNPPVENYVFLNVPESLQKLIPPCSLTQAITHDEVLSLYPDLNDKLLAELKRAESAVKSAHFENLKGIFEIKTIPLPKKEYVSDTDMWEKNMSFLLSKQFSGAETVFPPESGHFFLGEDPEFAGNPDNAKSILEGAIRKRFLYLVHFRIDFSNARVVGKAKKGPISKSFNEAIPANAQKDFQKAEKFVPCIPLPTDLSTINNDQNLERFLRILPTIDQKYPQVSLISRYDSSFSYGGSGEDVQKPPQKAQFVQPKFYNSKGQIIDVHRRGAEGFRPFNFFSLWSRKSFPVDELQKINFLSPDEGLIKPRGIIHCKGPFNLSPNGSGQWKIKGQGVIIADSFNIAAGITKSGPDDLLVMFTRKGSIRIDTDKRLEVVLMAINDNENGSILVQKPLNLKGALICDLLETYRWADGNHQIEYDPILKSTTDYQYQICLSPWTNFVKMSEE